MSGSVDTPFMRQYNALRREEPAGAVLLVRTGGYYTADGMAWTDASRAKN